jgi:complement component 1 Q subcomponent-binding protein, mitochondrial
MAHRNLLSSIRLLPAAVKAASAQSAYTWSSPCFSRGRLAVRDVHTSFPSYSLAKLINREISYEEEEKDDADSSLKNVPKGWTLAVKPGDTTMRLTKMKGSEKVEVVVNTVNCDHSGDIEPDEEEGDGEDMQSQFSINFDVECKKGDQKLEFSCIFMEADDSGPEIEHVSLGQQEDTKAKATDPTPYGGPTFSELDDDLQKAFAAYLKDHGVDADFCQYLCRLVYDKEGQEYVSWLKKVESFVKK